MPKTFSKDNDGSIMKTSPEPVDVQELKHIILNADNIITQAAIGRQKALAQLAAIKADIPDFDDTPLNPDLHNQASALLK